MLEKTKSLLKAVPDSRINKFKLLILNDVLKHLGLKKRSLFLLEIGSYQKV